jgi:hypothetical protein
MVPSSDTPLLELQRGLWKARAQAKQKWLERTLAESPNGAREVSERDRWIKQTLKAVKRGQAEVSYRAALLDAYAEHLSVLEMILIGATERRSGTQPASEQSKSKK